METRPVATPKGRAAQASGPESLLSSIAYLGTARAVVVCMNLVATSRLAHALGATNFGINSFAVSYVAYFLIVVNLGYDTFATREIAHDATKLRRMVDSMVTMRLILAVIFIGLLVPSLFLLGLPHLTRTVVLIQGINLFSVAIGLTSVFQGLQRMRVVASREFLGSLINMLGILFLVHNPSDVVLAAWVSAATMALTNLPLLLRYGQEYGMPRLRLPRSEDWEMARNSMTYFWSILMISVTYNIHIVLLGLLRNDTEVGLFTAGWKLFTFSIVVPNLLSTLFFPRIANLANQPAERARSTEIYMQAIILSVLPVTLFGCALIPQILMLLFGPTYMTASTTVVLLMVNGLVVALNIGFSIPLTAVGRQKSLLRVLTVGAAGGIILNLMLIPRFGANGAAIATLLDEMIILGMLMWDRPEVSVPQTVKFASRCLVAAIPAAIAVHFCANIRMLQHSDLAGIACGGLVGSLIYLLVLRLMRIDIRHLALGLRSLG